LREKITDNSANVRYTEGPNTSLTRTIQNHIRVHRDRNNNQRQCTSLTRTCFLVISHMPSHINTIGLYTSSTCFNNFLSNGSFHTVAPFSAITLIFFSNCHGIMFFIVSPLLSLIRIISLSISTRLYRRNNFLYSRFTFGIDIFQHKFYRQRIP
jgi:hypothetical protein